MTALVLALLLPSADAKDPWDHPAMEAPAKAWIKFADNHVDAEHPLTMLHVEQNVRIDEAGRKSWSRRYVYHVANPEDSPNWNNVTQSYAPWLQNTPTVRARVIHPSGEVHVFDSTSVSTFGPQGDDPRMYSDRRSLRGPLPKMVKGAIVEEVWEIEAHSPLLEGGAATRLWLEQGSMTTVHASAQVTVPEDLPLQWTLHGSDAKVKDATKAGSRTLFVETDESPPLGPWSRSYWLAEPIMPILEVSTWPSWNAVNEAYASLLADRVDADGLDELIAEVRAASSPEDALRRAVRGVQSRIRYTGLELGQKAIVPYSPKEIIERGFGDCKDSATTVVAVLRAAGHQASVALLDSGRSWQPAEPLPGMNGFDHAIVYSEDAPADFVDITASSYGLDALPASVQGRHALVISPETSALTTIPFTEAVQVERRTVDLRDGLGDVREHIEYRGWLHEGDRAEYADDDDVSMSTYIEGAYNPRGESSTVVGNLDVDSPFWTLDIEATDARTARMVLSEGNVLVSGGDLTTALPSLKKETLTALSEDASSGNFSTPMRPSRYELSWEVLLPPSVKATELPPTVEEVIGPITLRSAWTSELGRIDGQVEVAIRAGSLNLADMQKVVDWLEQAQLGGTWNIPVGIPAFDDLKARPFDAVRTLAQYDDPFSRTNQATMWLDLGQPNAARRVLASVEAPELEASDRTQWSLSVTDAWGRYDDILPSAALLEGMETIDCKLGGGNQLVSYSARHLLTLLDSSKSRISSDADLRRSVELLTRCLDESENKTTELKLALTRTLFELGELEQASAALADEDDAVAKVWRVLAELPTDADSSPELTAAVQALTAEQFGELVQESYAMSMVRGRWQIVRAMLDARLAVFGKSLGEEASAAIMRRLGHGELPQQPRTAEEHALVSIVSMLRRDERVRRYLDKDALREWRKVLKLVESEQGTEDLLQMLTVMSLAADRETTVFDDLTRVRFAFVGKNLFDVWLRMDGKRPQIIANPNIVVADKATEALDAGDPAEAKRWLATLEIQTKTPVGQALHDLLQRDEPMAVGTLRLATHLLSMTSEEPTEAFETLELDPESHDLITVAFFHDDTMAASPALTSLARARLAHPFHTLEATTTIAQYAASQGLADEALVAVRAHKDASTRYASHEAEVLMAAGRADQAYALLKNLPATEDVDKHRIAALAGLYSGHSADALAAWIRAVSGKTLSMDQEWLLAALLLEEKRFVDAQQVFTRAVEAATETPGDEWFFVRARLAQEYGLDEDAAADLKAFREGKLPMHMRPWAAKQ